MAARKNGKHFTKVKQNEQSPPSKIKDSHTMKGKFGLTVTAMGRNHMNGPAFRLQT